MTEPVVQPALARQAMLAEPWAGPPLKRPFRRLLGRAPVRPARRESDRRPLMVLAVLTEDGGSASRERTVCCVRISATS